MSNSKEKGIFCKITKKGIPESLTDCPICKLILSEPFQVLCCGKSFCKSCIQPIKAENKPCPYCNQDDFQLFPDKGLQLTLNGFQVFCSNQRSGCHWQGELGQLKDHLNSNPDKDSLLIGCTYEDIECLFCQEVHRRTKIKCHQDNCAGRPFTCLVCNEYNSTYDDVITNHAPVCKYRPVECPNSCGANNLQHQHLEEHVSTQCPLSYVDCEFSDAGCDVKVYRKDLSSHMEENVVTHVSLLARENRRLKLQHKESESKLTEYESKLNLSRVVPVDLVWSDVTKDYKSEYFYSHPCGYKLSLDISLPSTSGYNCNFFITLASKYPVPLPCKLKIILWILDPANNNWDKKIPGKEYNTSKPNVVFMELSNAELQKYTKNNQVLFHVEKVEIASSEI